ncbi:porin [Leyella stercorea]|uniref:porin n=1 Tax=Leyella stercorea TaxID=363265 RepID=UPI003FEEA1A4
MNKFLLVISSFFVSLGAAAQGNNTLMGGNDDGVQSIAERITKLEKKHDAFNVYVNFAGSVRAEHDSRTDEWDSKFANRQLRLEIKGTINDKLFYRLRHRLNKSSAGRSLDNFAKATDIMMVGYNINDKFTIAGGKLAQLWGGYEFDENPIYVYEYSDVVGNMGDFMTGVMASYHPTPSHEIAVEVSNTYQEKFSERYGETPVIVNGSKVAPLKKSNAPFVYILNWNGSMFGGVLNTRWSCGVQTQAKGKYSKMITLGQQLNLPKFQCYLDYMGAFDDLDQLGIATSEVMPLLNVADDETEVNPHFGKVKYHTLTAKSDWQFAPSWNLQLKGIYGITTVCNSELLHNYRRSYGYVGTLEYFPVKKQDFRVFLSYAGRKYNYTRRSTLTDYNTDRLELGIIYRIKAY